MFLRRAQIALLTLGVVGAVSFGAGLAYAQVPDVNVPDVNVDIPTPDVNVNVNPDVPSASEINCQIYADLMARGEPIPPGFDASGCEGNGGGGGGSTPACADGVDNDGDGLTDSADPGCSSSTDTDESNSTGGGGGNGGGDNGGGSGGSGGGSGGNSGGPAPACEDNVDNDGDGLKDMNDPGCSSASDTDETNSSSSGGGGGSTGTTTSATSTETTSASLTMPVLASCDMYLTTFIKPGAKNDSEQVKRLQSLLNESEGATLEVNGEYDAKTIAAVHAFQMKYASDILTPWGATKSTGFVYLTTKKKVNEVYCKMTKEFPLTTEEAATIAKTKSQIGGSVTAPRTSGAPKPASTEVTPVNENEVGSASKESQTAAAGESATRSLNRLWDPVRNFFGRVFGR